MSDREELMSKIEKNRYLDPVSTAEDCEELLRLAERDKDTYAAAFAYLFYGQVCYLRGRLSEGLQYALKGVKLQEEHQYSELLMSSYNVLAGIYSIQQDELLSLEYYYKGLNLARQENNYVMQSKIYNNISNIYEDYKDYGKALEYLKLSSDVYEKCEEDADKSYQLFLYGLNQTMVYYCMADYQEAWDSLNAACQQREQETQRNYCQVTLARLLVLNKLGREEEAEKLADEFMGTLSKVQEDIEIFDYLSEVVNYLMEKERYEDAGRVLDCMAAMAVVSDIPEHWRAIYEKMIEYFGNRNQQEEQLHAYMGYRYFSKKIAENQKKLTVQALDNRFVLRQEKEDRQRLTQDSEKWVQRSKKDELTGLENRSSLKTELKHYFDTCQREEIPMGLFILDIDYFKQYNDTYSHIMGDECLQKIARVVLDVLKEQDNGIAIRYGGDEFFIALKGKNQSEMEQIAEQIVTRIRNAQIPHKASKSGDYVSVSMGGICRIPAGGETYRKYIQCADQALYEVKRSGRNNYRIVTSLE